MPCPLSYVSGHQPRRRDWSGFPACFSFPALFTPLILLLGVVNHFTNMLALTLSHSEAPTGSSGPMGNRKKGTGGKEGR